MELTGAPARPTLACCGRTPRRTAGELFERGFRRNRTEPFALQGARLIDANGLAARFSVQLAGETIEDVRFKASSCATLIAYCELASEMSAGRGVADMAALTAHCLVAEVPDIHPLKRDRAMLAAEAFRSALARAISTPAAESAA
jgi:NifU-like protein involved in Fe-S cluster formation